MSVSAVSANTAAAAPQTKAAFAARAADGDYKAPTAKSSHVKDADGDYKALAPVGSAAGNNSSAVQMALSALKVGG